MTCVTSVSYYVIHNGERHGPGERGLRQGVSLSLYLFILCAEGLFNSLNALEGHRLIHECKAESGAPAISHIFSSLMTTICSSEPIPRNVSG